MSFAIHARQRLLVFVATASALLNGCVYIDRPRVEIAENGAEQSVEQVLGTFFLMSAIGGKAESAAALFALYPPRAQLVSYALIAFHRDRGAWPASADELRAHFADVPANPPLPSGALDGFEIARKDNGDATYSTREDRQRGRYFTITTAYRVSFPASVVPFAGRDAEERPPAAGPISTITFDLSRSTPPKQ